MKKFMLSLFVVSLALAGCQTAREGLMKAGKKPISGAELKSRYAHGPTYSFTSSRGKPSTLVYRKNGTVDLDVGNGSFVDSGTWVVKGDKLCTTYEKVRKGKEGCSEIFDVGDGKLKIISDTGEERVTDYKRIK